MRATAAPVARLGTREPPCPPAQNPMPREPMPEAHVNTAQLRYDHWARVRDAASRLRVDPEERDELHREIEHHLSVMAPYEPFFAFPGAQMLDTVRRRMSGRDYGLLADEMDRLEVLLSQLGDGAALLDDAFDLSLDVDELLAEGKRRRYFTVLVADSMTARQMREIRTAMRGARPPMTTSCSNCSRSPRWRMHWQR